MLTGMTTMIGIEPKIETVIGCKDTTTRMRGVVSTFHKETMIEEREVQG